MSCASFLGLLERGKGLSDCVERGVTKQPAGEPREERLEKDGNARSGRERGGNAHGIARAGRPLHSSMAVLQEDERTWLKVCICSRGPRFWVP